MNQTIPCWIYRSPKKDEMYLYIRQQDNFEDIPEALLKQFGAPVFVMQLDLDSERRLARENIATVIHNLQENGFHLQMPPVLKPTLYHGNLD